MKKTTTNDKLYLNKINPFKFLLISILMLSILFPAGAAEFPLISFIGPTPEDGTILTQDYVDINTTVTDPSSTTAFIDWNNSLFGWWRLNNENGESTTLFADWSGLNNNASCSGGSCPTLTSGKFGNALNFNGTQFINTPDNLVSNPYKNITVEAWIKGSSQEAFRYIICKYYDGDSCSYAIYTDTNGGLTFYVRTGSGSTEFTKSTNYGSGAWDNQWHHVVGTYDGENVRLYVDATKVGSDTTKISNIFSSNGGVFIGAFNEALLRFVGSIDEVRIHNRVLSQNEIIASYDAGTYAPTASFSGLSNGNYGFIAHAQNTSGNVSRTEKRTLTIRAYKLESYSDPAYNNIDNDFTGNEHIAYMLGTGFIFGNSYKFVYYDGDNGVVNIDNSINADSSGYVKSNYSFKSEDTPGLWHVEVLNVSAGPTFTYGSSTYSYSVHPEALTYDSFDVSAEAIPEFPEGIAIAFAASLLIFTYMRNKINNGKK